MKRDALYVLIVAAALGLLSACHSDGNSGSDTQPTAINNPPATPGTTGPNVEPSGPSDSKIGFGVLLNDIFSVKSDDEPVEIEDLDIESSPQDVGVLDQLLAGDASS